MMTIAEIAKRLSFSNRSYVAAHTKLNRKTLWRIESGRQKAVSYRTVKILSEYFDGVEHG